jgi:hypothetical protein
MTVALLAIIDFGAVGPDRHLDGNDAALSRWRDLQLEGSDRNIAARHVPTDGAAGSLALPEGDQHAALALIAEADDVGLPQPELDASWREADGA